jgi:hypothetical protein
MLEVAFTVICLILANVIFGAFMYALWAIVSEVWGGWGDVWQSAARRVQFTLPNLFAIVTICAATLGLLRLVRVAGWAAHSILFLLSLLWSLALVFGVQAIYHDVFRPANRRRRQPSSEPLPDFSSLTSDAAEDG